MLTTLSAQLILFLVSCLAVWAGAGLVLRSVTSLARTLHLPPFTMSFFVLGILTSLPEIVIGATAVYRGEAEIMIGNLIGATLVLFLLIIPLLALTGGGVKIPPNFSRRDLLLALSTVIAPTILIFDRQIQVWEGGVLLLMYLSLLTMLSRESSLVQKVLDHLQAYQNSHTHRLPKLFLGATLIYFASQQIVTSAEYFAVALSWSPFIVGLLVVSVGTNVPELSLVIRSVFSKQEGVALADYVGSAAVNTLLIGIFTLFNGSSILIPNHANARIILMLTGLILFYVFIRSKHVLSRREAFALLALYLIFVTLEVQSAG